MDSQMHEAIEEARRFASAVEGMLTEREGEFLYSLARNGPGEGVIVEIGSWKGKSTIWLAKGTQHANREQVYAIDHHQGSIEHREYFHEGYDSTESEFTHNIQLAGVEKWVVPLVMRSEKALEGWDIPVRFLWIDGDHEYESVKGDFLMWEPHLVDGGIIAFHDTVLWPGPQRVAEEYILRADRFLAVIFVDSITSARKVCNPPPFSILKKRYILFLRRIHLLGGKMPAPSLLKAVVKKIFTILGDPSY